MANRAVRPPNADLYVVALSGGRDSSAAGVWALRHLPRPRLLFVFADTEAELPETYAYLRRYEERLLEPVGLSLTVLKTPGFEGRLRRYGWFLPGPRARWCTKDLKITPMERWRADLGAERLCWIVGGRVDEDRLHKPAVVMRTGDNDLRFYPGLAEGWTLADTQDILAEAGIGESALYQLKPRSGCFNCFFQSHHSWRRLYEVHPDLYLRAEEWEERGMRMCSRLSGDPARRERALKHLFRDYPHLRAELEEWVLRQIEGRPYWGASPYYHLRGITLAQLRESFERQPYLPGLEPEEPDPEVVEAFSSVCDIWGLCR